MGRENLRVRGKRGCFTHEREIERGWGGGGSCVKEKRKMFYTSFRSKTFCAWEGFFFNFIYLFFYSLTIKYFTADRILHPNKHGKMCK